ncbi:MAG: signal peptidase I [Armatimonadota bacterium]|nr:signal peptidase I [Armatimonadota bacterium]
MSIIERCNDGAIENQTLCPKISARTPSRKGLAQMLRESAQTIALAILVFLFTISFIAQGYRVYGSCMEPNLRTGERLLGSKLAYKLRSPARGDIVVFKCPQDRSQIYIKRVIGLPGELVEIRDGVVSINGKRLSEPYLTHIPHGSYRAGVVKNDYLFVMGDYRDCSNDSRFWGQLPVSDIQAKAWVRYWPLQRASALR